MRGLGTADSQGHVLSPFRPGSQVVATLILHLTGSCRGAVRQHGVGPAEMQVCGQLSQPARQMDLVEMQSVSFPQL